jgi:LysR family glycine cleavage system transcriptional activator
LAARIPSLNALRVFEAAARHGGFASAAEELNVTPAAVSHQVKTLESQLEVALFVRHPRGLELTGAGRKLLPQLTRGLDHLARAVGSVVDVEIAGRLIVNAAPSFAALWLVPRLQGFIRAYPEVQPRILSSTRPPDLLKGEVDVRLTYGMGRYPGLRSRLLMREEVFPVCSPSLLNQSPLRRFADLRHHNLLHDINTGADEPAMTWRRWLRDAGESRVDPDRGVQFGDSILMTKAAARGQGVALGRTALVADYLASGRLVRPLKASRPADYAYYMVTTPAGAEQPRIRAFLDWIEAQVEQEAPVSVD